eukprot:6631409-Prorocentrum_lima.AAC.1
MLGRLKKELEDQGQWEPRQELCAQPLGPAAHLRGVFRIEVVLVTIVHQAPETECCTPFVAQAARRLTEQFA